MPSLFTPPHAYIPSGSGLPQAGALLYFYVTATSTPKDTYSDFALTVPNANPVVADANGVWPAIYLASDINYRVTVKTALGVLIYTQDDVPGPLMTQAQIGAIFYPRTALEISSGITPSAYNYPPGNLFRYNATSDLTGVADSTVAYQAAITTGQDVEIPQGQFNISDHILMVTPSQRVWGHGLLSVINCKSNFNLTRNGVHEFTAGGDDSGPQFENWRLICDQSAAAAGVRANLVAYPAAFYMRNTPRARWFNMRIEHFLIGMDCQGGSYGCQAENVDIGCYLLSWVVNGSGDTHRLRNFRCISFNSWTTNQRAIYADGGNTGIACGRCDGLNLENCIFFGPMVGINSFLGTGVNFAGTIAGAGFLTGFTTGLIVNTGFDTGVTFKQNSVGSWFNVANCYFSEFSGATNEVQLTAGTLTITNTLFSCSAVPSVPMVSVNNASGAYVWLQITGCRFDGVSPAGGSYTMVYATATGANPTEVILTGNQLTCPNTNNIGPGLIQIVGSAVILSATGNRFIATNQASQIGISIDTDNEHSICDNEMNGWLLAVPTLATYTTWTKAIIARNGKRGVINNNNANIRALAGNAGTATVAAASTVYLGPGGYANAVVSVNTFHMPKAGNIVGFQVKTSIGAGGAQTFIYTVYQNGVATAMTGTLTAGATVLNVITNFFAVAAADRIELQLVTSATAAAANHTFSILFEPA